MSEITNVTTPPTSSLNYQIVILQVEHAYALAQAHSICFPGYFLTSLGLPYVTLFYRALSMSDFGIGVVATGKDGKILGFAVGATKSSDFRRYFYRNFFLRSSWALFTGFFCDKDVRRYMLTQRYRITSALKLLLQKQDKINEPKTTKLTDNTCGTNVKAYSLMSLGTIPECRGSQMASDIINAFEAYVLQRGGDAVKVSTGKDNQRAIGFYQKKGYQIYRDTRPGDVDLIKYLIPIPPSPLCSRETS